MTSLDDLTSKIQEDLERQPCPEPFRFLGKMAAARHGESVEAVLAYGSCLRDGQFKERVADLYLLVTSYRDAGLGPVMATAARLLPPNVYYIECEGSQGETLRAKYALVTLDQFEAQMGPPSRHPYFWARFCQPIGLVFAKTDKAGGRVAKALANATLTLASATAPLIAEAQAGSSQSFWLTAFEQTYRTELRAERAGRNQHLYDMAPDHYDRRYDLMAGSGLLLSSGKFEPSATGADWLWWRHRQVGVILSLARLAKAAFTFSGGPDYLAWKIERHSGVKITLTKWQRRHPILAAPLLAISLYRKGAFR